MDGVHTDGRRRGGRRRGRASPGEALGRRGAAPLDRTARLGDSRGTGARRGPARRDLPRHGASRGGRRLPARQPRLGGDRHGRRGVAARRAAHLPAGEPRAAHREGQASASPSPDGGGPTAGHGLRWIGGRGGGPGEGAGRVEPGGAGRRGRDRSRRGPGRPVRGRAARGRAAARRRDRRPFGIHLGRVPRSGRRLAGSERRRGLPGEGGRGPLRPAGDPRRGHRDLRARHRGDRRAALRRGGDRRGDRDGQAGAILPRRRRSLRPLEDLPDRQRARWQATGARRSGRRGPHSVGSDPRQAAQRSAGRRRHPLEGNPRPLPGRRGDRIGRHRPGQGSPPGDQRPQAGRDRRRPDPRVRGLGRPAAHRHDSLQRPAQCGQQRAQEPARLRGHRRGRALPLAPRRGASPRSHHRSVVGGGHDPARQRVTARRLDARRLLRHGDARRGNSLEDERRDRESGGDPPAVRASEEEAGGCGEQGPAARREAEATRAAGTAAGACGRRRSSCREPDFLPSPIGCLRLLDSTRGRAGRGPGPRPGGAREPPGEGPAIARRPLGVGRGPPLRPGRAGIHRHPAGLGPHV